MRRWTACAALLLAGCVNVPTTVVVRSPDGRVIATVDTEGGEIRLTQAAYAELVRALRAGAR